MGSRIRHAENIEDTQMPEWVEMSERILVNWTHSRTPVPPDADVPPTYPSVTILNTRAAPPQGNVATRVTARPTRMKKRGQRFAVVLRLPPLTAEWPCFLVTPVY